MDKIREMKIAKKKILVDMVWKGNDWDTQITYGLWNHNVFKDINKIGHENLSVIIKTLINSLDMLCVENNIIIVKYIVEIKMVKEVSKKPVLDIFDLKKIGVYLGNNKIFFPDINIFDFYNKRGINFSKVIKKEVLNVDEVTFNPFTIKEIAKYLLLSTDYMLVKLGRSFLYNKLGKKVINSNVSISCGKSRKRFDDIGDMHKEYMIFCLGKMERFISLYDIDEKVKKCGNAIFEDSEMRFDLENINIYLKEGKSEEISDSLIINSIKVCGYNYRNGSITLVVNSAFDYKNNSIIGYVDRYVIRTNIYTLFGEESTFFPLQDDEYEVWMRCRLDEI